MTGPAPSGKLRPLHWPGILPEPAIRTAEDLSGVLARPGSGCTGPVYSMYRDVARSGDDRRWMQENAIRFDITVIPPRELCGEYVKTLGHYHPDDASGTGYPELYEVLAGEAHYLIQTADCSDVVLIVARAGDVVVVPSGYGHVTINPSRHAVLEMANLVSSRFSSNYSGYLGRHGAAYYEMADGTFVKNPDYPEKTSLRLVRAQPLSSLSEPLTDPLYDLVLDRAGILEFLNYPEKYEPLFRTLYP
jgi:glucose-6-phosphate isomerase